MYPATNHAIKTFARLISLLPDVDQAKPQIALLAGSVTPFRNDTDREMPFRQESNFYYLTGCTVPSSFLLVTYQSGTSFSQKPYTQLFIPQIELADLMWSVPPPTREEASSMYEVTRVENTESLIGAIKEQFQAYPDAIFHVLPNKPLFPIIPTDVLSVVAPGGALATDKYLLAALHQARLTKDEFELAEIQKANEISSRAHETVMRVLGQGVIGAIKKGKGAGVDRPLLPSEWLIEKEAEAEALFVASCRREGAVHQAYLPIVASASRASTLHYCCNDKEFAWGPVGKHDHKNEGDLAHDHARDLNPQVLLIDAGCEWNCYASDITRTMPVGNGGKFTPEARGIYELVLEMQQLSMQALKPGLHWDAIQLLCHQTLVKGFQRLGIFKTPESPQSGSWNSAEAILASGVSTAFFPHGVGHSLGMDVHDVPSASKPEVNETIGKGIVLGHPDFYTYLRLRLPLEVGMVVTVEPGIYFAPHLLSAVRDSRHIDHEVLKRYEGMGGVRIEDVVVITPDGHKNLTTLGDASQALISVHRRKCIDSAARPSSLGSRMFVLSIIKDTVAVHPTNFGLPAEQAITNELNKKYANRVLHEVGLCICVFDLSEAGEGRVRYGDGFLWYKVVFRLVVFRPFASEVILAKVKSSDEDGIRLSVGFFDDMYIPLIYLPEPSAFDPNERAHFWLPGSEATSSHELLDSPTTDRMYIDSGDIVRVRVEADEFYDDEPGPPKATEGVQQTIQHENRRAPYTVTCSIAEQGLGPVSWWKDAGVEAMDEG